MGIKAEYFNLAPGIYLAAPAELATPTEQNAIKATVGGKTGEGGGDATYNGRKHKKEVQKTNKQKKKKSKNVMSWI